MFTVIATATDYIVVSSSTQANFTISSENNLFTITNQTTNFSVSSTQTAVTVATLAGGFEFDANFLGNWTTGTYSVNNLVNYEYSLYVLSYTPGLAYNSTTPPSQDSNWRRVVWHEAPFNVLTATRATFVGTATFGGPTTFNNTATFAGTLTSDWIVTENFVLNGLTYPHNRGAYGQVLFTNGTDIANWVNLGDLQSWSLNEDLYTNGFNIVTGNSSTPLKIGVGTTTTLTNHININSTNIQLNGNSIVNANLNVLGTLSASSFSVAGTLAVGALDSGGTVSGNNFFVKGDLYGLSNGDPVRLNYGLRFPDGTILTSTFITTSSGFPIASTSILGAVQIGGGLSITENGLLSNSNPTPYSLPAASSTTRGGVRIGNGIKIVDGDRITADYSTATIGIISLTQDAYTNGFNWKNNVGGFYDLSIGTNISYFGHSEAGSNRGLFLYTGAGDYTAIKDQNIIVLECAGSNVFYATGTTVSIISPTITLASTSSTVVGTNVNHSDLRVQNIYNYAGTYAPVFPAGIQFGDNSVQFTAFTTSSLYQQYFDFQNPYDP